MQWLILLFFFNPSVAEQECSHHGVCEGRRFSIREPLSGAAAADDGRRWPYLPIRSRQQEGLCARGQSSAPCVRRVELSYSFNRGESIQLPAGAVLRVSHVDTGQLRWKLSVDRESHERQERRGFNVNRYISMRCHTSWSTSGSPIEVPCTEEHFELMFSPVVAAETQDTPEATGAAPADQAAPGDLELGQ